MRYYSSTAPSKTLASAITNTSTTIDVGSLTGLPTSYPYTLVIEPDTNSEEIVLVTGVAAGTSLNIVRGTSTYQGVAGGNGTSAQSHGAGSIVRHMVTARDLQEPQDHINATSGVHGLTGAVVGTTDAQTLTNKTINASNNTITVGQANVTGLTDALNAKATTTSVTDLAATVSGKAPLASPAFTGTPTAPTAAAGTNTTQLATTAFVTAADATKVNEPASTGLIVRTGAGTVAARSLVAGTNVTITNADGVAGNITINASGGTSGVTSVLNNTGAVTLTQLQIGGVVTTGNIASQMLANDGSGSNLDADLLDGQHGSYYAAATHTHASTGSVVRAGSTGITITQSDTTYGAFGSSGITFSGFSSIPTVVATADDSRFNVSVQSISSTGATIYARWTEKTASASGSVTVYWIATTATSTAS